MVTLVLHHTERPPALGPFGTQFDSVSIEVGRFVCMVRFIGRLRPAGKLFESFSPFLSTRHHRQEKQEENRSLHFFKLRPRSRSLACMAASSSSATFLCSRPSAARPKRK